MAKHRYPTSVRLSTHQKRRLAVEAKKRGHSVAGLIVWVLETWLEANETTERLRAPAQEGKA